MSRTIGRKRRLVPSEHESQCAFFQLIDVQISSLRNRYACAFAIPNGGDRHPAVARKLRAEGVRAGVLDVLYPRPVAGFAGLFLEFKKPGERPSDKQRVWIRLLRENGYRVELVYSAEEAWQVLRQYDPHTPRRDRHDRQDHVDQHDEPDQAAAR